MKGSISKAQTKNDDRVSVKRKSTKAKKVKDPNKPKRPPSAFFVFMEGFRMEFKEKNPATKGVAAIGKAGGDKWRSMTDVGSEKAPFVSTAEERKKDYDKQMKQYENKQASAHEEDESDKSKSEVNDEEDEDEGSEEEEDDD